ncbi:MAG: hypothetical protein KHW93_07165 [Butyricicoccus pullicaecorum]|nr:hypothetical protein [Butyricicoccus pullicaecorum]
MTEGEASQGIGGLWPAGTQEFFKKGALWNEKNENAHSGNAVGICHDGFDGYLALAVETENTENTTSSVADQAAETAPDTTTPVVTPEKNEPLMTADPSQTGTPDTTTTENPWLRPRRTMRLISISRRSRRMIY